MQGETIENLIEKYLGGMASIDEIDQLNKWYDSFDSQADLYVPDTLELNEAVAKGFSVLKLKLGIV